MSAVYVLDACALLAIINNEQGADRVEGILREALEGNTVVYMNKINLYEVYYGIYRVDGQTNADKVYQIIQKQPIDIIDVFSDDVFREAARLKAKYKISLADSIALGEASMRNASLLSSDHHEFDIVEQQESIKFDWIR
ncbi:PilT protein domain protein [Syntrophobotulus glycolicus DSM 8271]|uniref:PilT protein domain protein n=1 Tax=Syntrophobotulus glycolicus (strain DSM 8271 / FlGlyR) TaxID=645991 RepID=F0STV8_SYNGF|nr:type II toxin-antitoxin system VapC family toxin [Syntrophobotulus glycolicus]ADY55398.1 PilT protein domain protein [Syntrophobotulus glycolicus DSM 8271]